MAISDLFKLGGLKRRANRNGVSQTPTFNRVAPDQILTMPIYLEHLRDLYRDRLTKDTRTLLKELFRSDPDMSAAVNAYLTTANTEPMFFVRDEDGNLDRDGFKVLTQILRRLTLQTDYSRGFQLKPSLATLCENMRYMVLLRGGIATEAVFDRTYAPAEIRQVDMASLRWKEKAPGQYKPVQVVGNGEDIDLDIPNFFVSFFRRDPGTIYTNSFFVSAINTIAARQQVINDLYRIMYVTGYPRIDITILEEVVRNNAPASVKANPEDMKEWLLSELKSISQAFGSLRVDQAFVHYDAVEPKVINDRSPGAAIDISKVVEVLNGQNQAGLKTMATIIGRGESGVNTASVEARIFSMNSDEINGPVAENLSQLLTFCMRMQGRPNYVEVVFRKVELRPSLELENHKTMKQARLLENLSLGLISDDEYHIEMFGRPRPDWAPVLSGTGFRAKKIEVDPTKISPNDDPLGRGLTPDGGDMADSNALK